MRARLPSEPPANSKDVRFFTLFAIPAEHCFQRRDLSGNNGCRLGEFLFAEFFDDAGLTGAQAEPFLHTYYISAGGRLASQADRIKTEIMSQASILSQRFMRTTRSGLDLPLSQTKRRTRLPSESASSTIATFTISVRPHPVRGSGATE